MASRRAQRGGKRRSTKRRRAAKPPLAGSDLLAVIDELDTLDLTLETLPTLTLMARTIVEAQRRDRDGRDRIALLGLRRGIDVDKDTPSEERTILDAASAPDTIVEAVRWRLQRVTAALSAAKG